MSSQSLESYQSVTYIRSHGPSRTQSMSRTQDTSGNHDALFPKVVFGAVVGIGYACCLAAALYPVYMHLFYFDY
jgi:hypothetical protein